MNFLVITSVVTLILYILHKCLENSYYDWSSEDRGFVSLTSKFHTYSIRSFILGSIGGSVFGAIFVNVYLGVLVGITLYALIFSTQTDLKVHKAPKEINSVSILFAIPVVAVSLIQNYYNQYEPTVLSYYDNNYVSSFITKGFAYLEGGDLVLSQIFNFSGWMLIPILLFLVSKGGLGMADIRLFILLGVTTSWWLGILPMMLLFFIANIIQIISFLPAKKRNLGEMVILDNGKEKFAVPFIPAITIGYVLGLLIIVIAIFI